MAFSAFGLHPDLVRGIKELGFTRPTPIQTDAIPPAMVPESRIEPVMKLLVTAMPPGLTVPELQILPVAKVLLTEMLAMLPVVFGARAPNQQVALSIPTRRQDARTMAN